MGHADAQQPQRTGYGSATYAWYVTVVLTLVYMLNAIDRGLPSILIEPLRHEFRLTDSQLGLYSGPAYALAYSLAIIPMGYISDRSNRRNVLTCVLIIWSALTALASAVRSFPQLLATRIGVGAAEAGTVPLILPMISDIFPAGRRGLALGILYAGSPVGVFLGSVGAGYVAADHGWRAAFLLAGAPGLVVAALMYLTVREPRRGGAELDASGDGQEGGAPGLLGGVRFLLQARAVLFLVIGCAVLGLINITISTWIGSFFIRLHSVGVRDVGVIIGVGAGLCGMVGPLAMGWIADAAAAGDQRKPIRLVWACAIFSGLATIGMLFTPSLALAVALFVIGDLLRSGYAPPVYSVIMANTPPRLRGSVMSILALLTNLMGFGLGPLLTGVLSDIYGGGESIKYALASILVLFVPVAAIFEYSARLLWLEGVASKHTIEGAAMKRAL